MGSIALNTGLKALLSSQFVLDSIGHNIANANTPGYSRQRVDLSASTPLQSGRNLIGTGVDPVGIQRTVDALLERRLLSQRTVGANLAAQVGGMTEIESIFGEPDGASLGAALDGFFSAVSDLSASPDDSILRTGLVQTALTMTTTFRSIEGGLTSLRTDTESTIDAYVDQVNQLAGQIATLNVNIGEVESTGVAANDLRDQRQVAIESLADLVDIETADGTNGSIRVMVAGNSLVSSANYSPMELERDPMGKFRLKLDGSTGYVPVTGGAIGGLLDMTSEMIPALGTRLDELAKSLVLELNRVHSTGVPAGGPFSSLSGSSQVVDRDKDGKFTDELLSNAGLPFDVVSGSLAINVSDLSTSTFERHSIPITTTHTTVGDFLDAVNAIPELSADVDAFGRVSILADAGYGFDFSNRLAESPDSSGTLGGGAASLGTSMQEPFGFVNGDTLDLTVDPAGTPVSISIPFQTADFAEISQATAAELAAVINSDPAAIANGISATDVDGHLFLQTASSGSGAAFQLDGGAASTALGWDALAGSTVSGHDNAIDATVDGAYTGSDDDTFTFVPNMDGTIGTTPGLSVDVFDSSGNQVASLDVGDTYVPGTTLAVAEGISVTFGLGDLSTTHADRMTLDVVADSDTADVLVALGINGLLTGSTAKDIDVRADIQADPSMVAASFSGASGDSSLLLSMLDVENKSISDLGNETVSSSYGDLVGELGFQVSTTMIALDANDTLVASLSQQRDQISGVSVDEEMVEMLKFEQAFSAAAQFISVVNQLEDEVLNIL